MENKRTCEKKTGIMYGDITSFNKHLMTGPKGFR